MLVRKTSLPIWGFRVKSKPNFTMKSFKLLTNKSMRVMALIMIACFSLISESCNKDSSTPMPTQSIVAIAQANNNLSTLVAALTKFPDLVSTLSGSGTFTVFAPSNAAFASLLTAIGQTSLDDIPEDVLKKILQYHVVTTTYRSNQFVAGNVNTVANENIAVTLTGGLKLNGSVNVTTADVAATNGVVHVIDAVLVNPSIVPIVGTIVAPAYFNKNFTTLIAAVTAASPAILTTLLSSDKKTLFAPTNDAFTAAGITSLPDQATLDAVLTYHVLNSEVRAANLPTNTAPTNSTITTLNGPFYLSNRGSAGVFINGTTKVIQTDIIASNGTVHVIDRTLIPPSKTIKDIAVGLSTASSPQFTQLVAALGRVPALLDAAGSTSSKLTVFAPTDAAFQALYTALGVGGINDIDLNTLTNVLKQHIISAPTTESGRIFSVDLVNGSVATLNGNVRVSATNGTVTSTGGTVANISSSAVLINVLGNNGVIHTIDKVLVP
jgi:transforming growth factor-beta-induced protein